jgi:predicted metalloprotease with PDZ domain
LAERQRELIHTTLHDWFLHSTLDYPQWDVLHPAMWAEEGLNEYFGVRVARESGNWSAEQANAEWLWMYDGYTTNILGTPNDVPLVDFDIITGTAKWHLWYHKGALVNHLLDYQVGQVTGGTKSIEDVFRFLHDHVPNTESDRLDVDEFLLAYNLVTGHDFGSFFSAYITGIEPLPFVVVSDTLQIDDAALPDTPAIRLIYLPIVLKNH